MKSIWVYTDGSCNVKNRLGGLGVYLQFKEQIKVLGEHKISRGYSDTTISRMELRAIIEGLQALKEKKKYKIIFISDSQYTVNSINKGWVFRWESENFEERANPDLWKLFLKEYREFPISQIQFIHTRGHEKGEKCYHYGNGIADSLADYKQFTTYIKDEKA